MADDQKRPLTDDHGRVIRPQGHVIETRGRWMLLYEGDFQGNHQFFIEKTVHRVAVYPGISLDDARKRFEELVENDYD